MCRDTHQWPLDLGRAVATCYKGDMIVSMAVNNPECITWRMARENFTPLFHTCWACSYTTFSFGLKFNPTQRS